MREYFEKIASAPSGYLIALAVATILAAMLIYFALVTLKSNKAIKVIWYYLFFTVVLGVILVTVKLVKPNFVSGGYIMLASQAIFVLAVVVLFATEIKRAIWDRRRHVDLRHGDNKFSSSDASACIDEIIKAVQNMSKNDVGAIIILSNGNLPNGVLDSGTKIDAAISAQLIESIFFPKTPLHDGAMILYGTKIQAAGCFLPMAQEINLSSDLGSRHRAGIGLTETVNVTAIIVSEETGIISIAKGGKIVRYVDTATLRDTLKNFYWKDFVVEKSEEGGKKNA